MAQLISDRRLIEPFKEKVMKLVHLPLFLGIAFISSYAYSMQSPSRIQAEFDTRKSIIHTLLEQKEFAQLPNAVQQITEFYGSIEEDLTDDLKTKFLNEMYLLITCILQYQAVIPPDSRFEILQKIYPIFIGSSYEPILNQLLQANNPLLQSASERAASPARPARSSAADRSPSPTTDTSSRDLQELVTSIVSAHNLDLLMDLYDNQNDVIGQSIVQAGIDQILRNTGASSSAFASASPTFRSVAPVAITMPPTLVIAHRPSAITRMIAFLNNNRTITTTSILAGAFLAWCALRR